METLRSFKLKYVSREVAFLWKGDLILISKERIEWMNIDILLPLNIKDKAIKNTINMRDFLITDCEHLNISWVFIACLKYLHLWGFRPMKIASSGGFSKILLILIWLKDLWYSTIILVSLPSRLPVKNWWSISITFAMKYENWLV